MLFLSGRSLGTWNLRGIMPSPRVNLYLNRPAKIGGPAKRVEPEVA